VNANCGGHDEAAIGERHREGGVVNVESEATVVQSADS
jgi:hypothetical protein